LFCPWKFSLKTKMTRFTSHRVRTVSSRCSSDCRGFADTIDLKEEMKMKQLWRSRCGEEVAEYSAVVGHLDLFHPAARDAWQRPGNQSHRVTEDTEGSVVEPGREPRPSEQPSRHRFFSSTFRILCAPASPRAVSGCTSHGKRAPAKFVERRFGN
jgi:hypothetical protein